MPIFRGTNNIKKIFRGNNEIVKVFRGTNLIFTSGLPQYEELADIIVTSNTTQIDFNNLNITKDDELLLVSTIVSDTSHGFFLYANNNTSNNDYSSQQLVGNDSSLTTSRTNRPPIGFGINGSIINKTKIKISNNDRFVLQTSHTRGIGSLSNVIENNEINVSSLITISSITSLNLIATSANKIFSGSRLQLYKVNTGVA